MAGIKTLAIAWGLALVAMVPPTQDAPVVTPPVAPAAAQAVPPPGPGVPVVVQQVAPGNWPAAWASMIASIASVALVALPIYKMMLEHRYKLADLERQTAANRDGIGRALNNQKNLEQTAAGFAVVGLMDEGIVREPGTPSAPAPAVPGGGAS